MERKLEKQDSDKSSLVDSGIQDGSDNEAGLSGSDNELAEFRWYSLGPPGVSEPDSDSDTESLGKYAENLQELQGTPVPAESQKLGNDDTGNWQGKQMTVEASASQLEDVTAEVEDVDIQAEVSMPSVPPPPVSSGMPHTVLCVWAHDANTGAAIPVTGDVLDIRRV